MSKMKLSSVKKIVRFISDIDIKTTMLQNTIYLIVTLFIIFAKRIKISFNAG